MQVRPRMKIAFATRDHEHVDDQFRSAPHLDVYEVTGAGAQLDRACEFPPERRVGTDERMRAIAGSAVVFVSAIGPSLAARLAAHGFRVATAPAGTRIAELLGEVQRAIGARAGDTTDAQVRCS